MTRRFLFLSILVSLLALTSCCNSLSVHTLSDDLGSDLVKLLGSEGFRVKDYQSLDELLSEAPEGAFVVVSASDGQPARLSDQQLRQMQDKNLRVLADFYAVGADNLEMQKVEYERVVVTDPEAAGLDSMTLLATNCGMFYKTSAPADDAIMVLARVAGFNKAEFGLADTESFPLVRKIGDGFYLSTMHLADFCRLRFMPEGNWKIFFETVISDLTGSALEFKNWPVAVAPAYGKDEPLPSTARLDAVRKGIEWFYNGHFLVHPSWKADWIDKYKAVTVGPGLPDDLPDGDGSLGVLEGHSSAVYEDGMQAYRYFMRADVHGESAMAFALASKLLENDEYQAVAGRLLDYAFDEFAGGPHADPASPLYGLIGHNSGSKDIYYGDDNARFILGAAACAALGGEGRWDERIVRAIDANYNTTSHTGFRGPRLEDPEILEHGLPYFQKRELFCPHPHYESWMWACYLMQYGKTGEAKYLDLARRGISATMAVYPDGLEWTNGLQQEKARMVLPLAWLYRADPSQEHLEWIKTVVADLRSNQDACGAIMEQLGDPSKGDFGTQTSNEAYGTTEAPLIFRNGDPVADMLYTCNFAAIGLHEAACATGDPQIGEVCSRLCDFFVRIQARSSLYRSLDGAWFRAFNYGDWNYWASNADQGWGALGTLTGWTQSWIVSTLALEEMDLSLWDIVF